MGRKKSKRSNNQHRRQEGASEQPHTLKQPLNTLVVDKNLKSSDLRSISALSMDVDEFDKQPFTNSPISLENVSLSSTKMELCDNASESYGALSKSINLRNNTRHSSYHNLVDGGAYKDFSSKFTTSVSEVDFDSAGDRVLAGSRSISHNSLQSKRPNPPENKDGYFFFNSKPNNFTDSEEKVRSYHPESLDTRNYLSKLSIHSNNDEFILIAGHPPSITVPNGIIESISHAHTDENSASNFNASITEINTLNAYNSTDAISKVITSQNSLETSSNTDDRLKLAAKHSLSPEAEGLVQQANKFQYYCATEDVKDNEQENLISRGDEKTSEIVIPFNRTGKIANAFEAKVSDQIAPKSNNFHEPQSPQKALVVTSALTPLVPKRTRGSHNQSNDSMNLAPPETVQRIPHIKQIRPLNYESDRGAAATKDISVQTGNTIRLRQNPWTDVLSEYAYHSDSYYMKKNPIRTDCVSYDTEKAIKSNDESIIADHSGKNSMKKITKLQHYSRMSFENMSRSETRENSGDTLKKYVPKGRIRDLAAVFNNLGTSSTNELETLSLSPKFGYVGAIVKNDNVVLHKGSEPSSNEHSDCSSFGAFKSSTQNMNSHGDRLKSTSSSLHCPPKVFTRNTFVSRDVNSSNTTVSDRNVNSVDLRKEYHSSRKMTANSMMIEDQNFRLKEHHPPIVDVPIRKIVSVDETRSLTNRKRHSPIRAKTQDVFPVVQFNSHHPIRAMSGNIYDTDDLSCFPLTRKLFGNSECDDLVNERESSSELHQSFPCGRAPTIMNQPHYSECEPNCWKDSTYSEKRDLKSTIAAVSRKNVAGKEQKELHLPTPHIMYSPPVTEDAGSRITHHTSTTVQDDPFATEDSIRGKIDKMFAFVEGDESRKHARDISGSPSSVAFMQDYFKESEQNDKTSRNSPRKQKTSDCYDSPADNDLEYSLSHYREIQREQLRRRLPSTDEPKFFRSPSISVPHAGQRVHAYKTRELLGKPGIGKKDLENTSNIEFGTHPVALATSTPRDSPQSRLSFSSKYISELKNNYIANDTFVSSISAASLSDNKAEVAKRIDRLSYMIENTQKQMEMNEAALLDAIKKGRRMQEVAANRSILITRETLRLQRNELRRLHAFSAVRRPPPPMSKELRGSVVFRNLVVQLNKLFVLRLTEKDENSYSFVGIFKFGHIVEATELVPLRICTGDHASEEIIFNKQIQFSDVPVDFMIIVEIYAMRLQPVKSVDISIGAVLANKCKTLMGPPHKKSQAQSVETAFKFRGRLVLDRDASGDRSFYLDDVTYPLEGTIRLTTVCSRLPEAFETMFNGFLTMFHTVSHMASWERYWAVIRRGTVFFWKYPDDERMGQDPKMQIDLTKCTNNTIHKCEFELCPRANSFAIDLLVDADYDSVGNVVEKKRVLLSTDSTELMAQWLFAINQTLDVIRGPI